MRENSIDDGSDMADDGDLGGEPACWAHLFDDTGADGADGADLADLSGSGTSGAIWSLRHGGDLDANVVWLRPDDKIDEHVNDEVDVLLVVWSGRGELTRDGRPVALRAGTVVLIDRGVRRRIAAGAEGVTYLSVHRRRDGLTITRR